MVNEQKRDAMIRLYRVASLAILEYEGNLFCRECEDWDALINRSNLHQALLDELPSYRPYPEAQVPFASLKLMPPLQSQEVWASGVTYLRSREARMEESENSGASDFYARVYEAERPELFFKASPQRVVGPEQGIRIRRDSKWNVPEPELTLFCNSVGEIVGYTVGNDMSSRDIEGENPLYLPQSKTYDASAAIGPCLLVTNGPIKPDTLISMRILRGGEEAFSGNIALNRMKRQLTELVGYLFREISFPQGVFLMTGTGLVPGGGFTLEVGDLVEISIEGIGTLRNVVEQKPG
jgi:2-dehydro-3-deoxy-D-arabinonate dehydratase